MGETQDFDFQVWWVLVHTCIGLPVERYPKNFRKEQLFSFVSPMGSGGCWYTLAPGSQLNYPHMRESAFIQFLKLGARPSVLCSQLSDTPREKRAIIKFLFPA